MLVGDVNTILEDSNHIPAVQKCSAPRASRPSLSCALALCDASYSEQRYDSLGDSLPPCVLYAAVPDK